MELEQKVIKKITQQNIRNVIAELLQKRMQQLNELHKKNFFYRKDLLENPELSKKIQPNDFFTGYVDSTIFKKFFNDSYCLNSNQDANEAIDELFSKKTTMTIDCNMATIICWYAALKDLLILHFGEEQGIKKFNQIFDTKKGRGIIISTRDDMGVLGLPFPDSIGLLKQPLSFFFICTKQKAEIGDKIFFKNPNKNYTQKHPYGDWSGFHCLVLEQDKQQYFVGFGEKGLLTRAQIAELFKNEYDAEPFQIPKEFPARKMEMDDQYEDESGIVLRLREDKLWGLLTSFDKGLAELVEGFEKDLSMRSLWNSILELDKQLNSPLVAQSILEQQKTQLEKILNHPAYILLKDDAAQQINVKLTQVYLDLCILSFNAKDYLEAEKFYTLYEKCSSKVPVIEKTTLEKSTGSFDVVKTTLKNIASIYSDVKKANWHLLADVPQPFLKEAIRQKDSKSIEHYLSNNLGLLLRNLCANKNTSLVKALIETRKLTEEQVNSCTASHPNQPPLHLAVQAQADSRLIKLLLDQGANPLAKNADGLTPADLTNDSEIKKILEGTPNSFRHSNA